MATHSGILAWRISWTEDLGDCSPWDRKKSDTTEATEHAYTSLLPPPHTHTFVSMSIWYVLYMLFLKKN